MYGQKEKRVPVWTTILPFVLIGAVIGGTILTRQSVVTDRKSDLKWGIQYNKIYCPTSYKIVNDGFDDRKVPQGYMLTKIKTLEGDYLYDFNGQSWYYNKCRVRR